MRNRFYFAAVLLLTACNNPAGKQEDGRNDTTYIEQAGEKTGFDETTRLKNLVWLPVFDSVKGGVLLKKQRPVSADTLTAEKLIREINASWEGIQLEIRKVSQDTIYVAIPEAKFLTQEMGSSGANGYMYSTTFILTELKQIKFVNFEFIEGDHLAPGTFKRSDFEN